MQVDDAVDNQLADSGILWLQLTLTLVTAEPVQRELRARPEPGTYAERSGTGSSRGKRRVSVTPLKKAEVSSEGSSSQKVAILVEEGPKGAESIASVQDADVTRCKFRGYQLTDIDRSF